MTMLRQPALRIAATVGPWMCLCMLNAGCMGLPGRDHQDPAAPTAQTGGAPGTEAAPASGRTSYEVAAGETPATEPGQPVRTVAYQPSAAQGRAAMLGNPRIGPNSELTWSIRDLPGAPSSLVGGRGTVDRDGRLDLGGFGSIIVGGLTPAEAVIAIEDHVKLVVANGGRRIDAPMNVPPPVQAPAAAPRETVATMTPAAPAKAAWGPVGSKPRAEVMAAASPRTFEPPMAMKPKPDAGIRQVGFQQVASAPPMPPGAKPAAPAASPVGPQLGQPPAEDPLPAPRTVPGDEHLTPIPVEGGPVDTMPAPRELAMASLPPYVLDPPDVLLVESTQGLRDQPIRGQHLIRPDGTISLGIYGSVHVAGMTIEHARAAVAVVLAQRIKDFDPRNLFVDVLSYNSKVYYVITDGGGYGEQVYRVPVTGSETVLDAISQINGLPPVASKRRIWIARRTPGDNGPQVYPVNWRAITQEGISTTNYQVLPGDRIYVQADCLMRIDAALAKFLSPIQRILGTTLLGASTVNTIGGSGSGAGVAGTFIAR
jgi:polysaccharide export outer membrane protein